MSETKKPLKLSQPRLPWLLRAVIVGLVLLATVVVWVTNSYLTTRFTQTTRQQAELRQALYAGSVHAELQRNSVVPLLLSQDPVLTAALRAKDYTATSQRLIAFVEEIEAASIVLVETGGRVVAATNRELLGENFRNKPFVVEALRSEDTVFTVAEVETGGFEFFFSRAIRDGSNTLGVIEVEVDLAKFEARWRGADETIAVTDSTGRVILSTAPHWKGADIETALSELSAPSAITRAIEATGDWAGAVDSGFFSSEAIMQTEARIPFRGWRLTGFTSYASVRERVNGVLALEIMGFALLLAGAFFALTKRAQTRSNLFQRESVELRRLNIRLNREIAERQRVQENLKVAEASLEQSSKLAALGEMSAAVSHELNQPLAAMKTYLAGARLLMERDRTEEATASFQRIDDLIERMTAITRQLKSYARKGGEAFEPVDVREALSAALILMEPQLKTEGVTLVKTLPDTPVIVNADRLRLEQVVINLVRNALDAMKGAERKELDILVSVGKQALMSVRDTGEGIKDLDNLFEPFYTTKRPGEGVGLGLAISSSIIDDFGGRLSARNGANGGAVFEVALPIMKTGRKTAAE